MSQHTHVVATRQIGPAHSTDSGPEVQTGALSHGIAAHRASGGGALAGSGQSDHAGDAVQLSQHPEEVEGGPSVNMQDLLKHVIGAPIVPKNRELPPPGPPPKRDWYPGQ